MTRKATKSTKRFTINWNFLRVLFAPDEGRGWEKY